MMHETVTAAPVGVAFTAAREPLLAALDYLARHIVVGRNSIPILSNVRIEATPGALVISATDLDVEAAFTVPAYVDCIGTFTAPAASLRDVVKAAAKGAQITMRIDHHARLIVTSGRARNGLPTIGLKDWPVIACPRGNAGFTLPGAQLATDLARVAPFMSKEETRWWLNGALFELTPAGLAIAATEGANVSVVTRAAPDGAGDDLAAIVSRKTIDALQRALKAFPCDTVTLSFGPGKVMIQGDAFGIVAKLIDGTFPDYRGAIARALGDELQTVMDAEGEPRIFSEALKAFAKAAGPVTVEMGDKAARLSIAGDPSWFGVMMLAAPGAVPKSYSYRFNPYPAQTYLESLCERHAIALPEGDRRIIHCNGIAQGMTVGTFHHERKIRQESMLDWEALVERDVVIVEHEAGWQEGAISIVMPRCNEAVVASETVDVAGELIPLAMNARGQFYMTEAQVAAWCGPVDPSTHVAIAPRPMAKAWWKKDAPVLAPKPIANALQASAADLAAYTSACQAAADRHNAGAVEAPAVAIVEAVEPEPVAVEASAPVDVQPAPVPAVEPVQAAPSDDSAALVARVAKLESLVHELQARALANGSAPTVAADHGDDAPAPLPSDARARAVVTSRDARTVEMVDVTGIKRLRIVRRYLAMRRDRAALRALQVQHAIGQAQFDDVKARLATAESELVRRDELAELSGSIMERQLSQMQADVDRHRAITDRALDVEEALLNARARGDRMARVAMRQRTGLARAAIDLRGARAETGAVRRQLAQALQPVTAPVAPTGTMAVAFAAARG